MQLAWHIALDQRKEWKILWYLNKGSLNFYELINLSKMCLSPANSKTETHVINIIKNKKLIQLWNSPNYPNRRSCYSREKWNLWRCPEEKKLEIKYKWWKCSSLLKNIHANIPHQNSTPIFELKKERTKHFL